MLHAAGRPAMPTTIELLDLLARPAADPAEVQDALENCGAAPPAEQPAVVSYLSDGTADQMYWAATLIGRDADAATRHQDVLAAVVCSTRPPAARQRAAWALSRCRDLADANRLQLQRVDATGDTRLARLIDSALQRPAD